VGLKSIIDVDIDDSKFQRFRDQFERYTQLLQKQPEIWKRIGGMHQQHAAGMGELAKTMSKITQLRQQALKDSHDEGKELEHTSRLWSSVSRSAKDVSTNIETGARGLMKWATLLGGIGAGLLGVGGLLGFSSLASTIGGQRRTAGGLGMTIGEEQAFNTDFGRFLDTKSFMGWVGGMQQDITKQAPAMALLHRPLSGTSADYLQMLDAVRAFARQPRFQGARGLGLLGPVFGSYGLNLSEDDQRRLRDMSDTEYNSQRGKYLKDAQALNIPDRGAMAFQNFTTQMDRVAQQMRATLGGALMGLAGPLTRLSGAFANALSAFLRTDAVRDGLNSLATGLNDLAKFLGSAQFKEDVKSFSEGLHEIVEDVKHPLSALPKLGQAMWDRSLVGEKGPLRKWWGMASPWLFPTHDWAMANLGTYMARQDEHWNIGPGTVELFKAMEDAEATRKSGVRDIFKQPDLPGGKYSYTTDAVGLATHTAQMVAELMRRFNGDQLSILTASRMGPEAVEALQKRWGAKDWFSHVPADTQSYVGRAVTVIIQNQTGGSATASVSALGAQ
jgi:hypothetical protein